MDKERQTQVLEEYYTILEYGVTLSKKEAALMEISTLTDKMKFVDVNDFSDRFVKTASVIKKHLPIFNAVCQHPDTVTTILEYLNYFSMKLMLCDKYDEEYEKDDVILLAILTILTIQKCNESELYLFLENALIKNSELEKSISYTHFISEFERSYTIEIILLEDSDLYAVIRYLRNRKSIIPSTLVYFQVWVQEPIKEKFLWLVKEYLELELISIYTFRTKKEFSAKLFTAKTPNTMSIISIWTENVVFAKNLAMSLNRDVVFINTCMDFYGGIVLLPYTKAFNETLRNWYIPNLNNSVKKLSVQENSVYNLFYDGMLQQPIKGTYWIHNDSLWANATSDDVSNCIKSAEDGFKIWSSKCISSRMQILSKFASTLERSGKSRLANMISIWISKCLYIYENSLSCFHQGGSNTKLEVTKIRNPRGTIILKATDEDSLFRQLMCILVAGNSVIVICDTNSCSLVPYCNMFSISDIPPGVINLLSSENLNELELSLCGMDYASYAEQLFSANDHEKTYINLTKLKQIIVPLK